MVMKGHLVEKGREAAANPKRSSTNIGQWAQQAAAAPTCQYAVDTKAFTGRGTRQELRHWVDRLDVLEREMAELSCKSKEAAHTCGAYLAIHRRASTGYVHLRWREHGAGKRHLLADQVHAMTEGQVPFVRNWVSDVNAMAERLNAAHKKARIALREIRDQVTAKPQPLLPRSISALPGAVGGTR